MMARNRIRYTRDDVIWGATLRKPVRDAGQLERIAAALAWHGMAWAASSQKAAGAFNA
jgi:hypothetical protein